MKKLLVILCLLVFAMPCFAEAKILHSYSALNIYYLYDSDFNISKFKIPDEIKDIDSRYTIFVYDKEINPSAFKSFEGSKIENSPRNESMYLVGLYNKPIAYILHDQKGTIACELKDNYDQIKYVYSKEEKRFIKQIAFNTGEFTIHSVCNPYAYRGDMDNFKVVN